MKRYRKKTLLLLILLLVVAVTQVSCWDQNEAEDLGIIVGTAVETAPEGRVRVTVQEINPSGLLAGGDRGGTAEGGAAKSYRNYSLEADTIFDAIRNISKQSPRTPFFAHNQIIIISEELARDRGVSEVIDFFERAPQIRLTTWVLVSKGDILALLDQRGALEATPAMRIFEIINEQNLTSHYAPLRLGDFIAYMENDNTQTFTAGVEREQNLARPEDPMLRFSEGHLPEPQQNVLVRGTAVFNQDKLTGWLNDKESRGLLWIRGEVRGGIVNIPVPEQKNKTISLEIIRSKTKLEPEIRDGQIYITITVKEESDLVETTGTLDLTKPETIKKLEAEQNAVIQEEITAALDKVQQEFGVDVFGFGQAVHRKHPQQWKQLKKNWPELFPEVSVQIQVESLIRRTGMVTKPSEPGQR